MKLNGALKPHGGPKIGCSIGAKKYRDKRVENIVKLSLKEVDKIPEQINSGRTSETSSKNYNRHHKSTLKSIASITANCNNTYKNQCYSKGIKKMAMRYQQSSSLLALNFRFLRSILDPSIAFNSISFTANSFVICIVLLVVILQQPSLITCQDDNFFVSSFPGPETVTPEFDYASRGKKKFGDKCENTLECGFPGSVCDSKKRSCQCTDDLPVTNHIDKCGKMAAVNESCFFNEQCEAFYFQTHCLDGHCICRFDLIPTRSDDGNFECKLKGERPKGPETYIDPAMIGVLVGMALMFVIICVVLRLFSQARWHENRTIFNTPNPRLMNVSLLRENKHLQERRGSRLSQRGPSRQPSMASLRPHSPNPSLGKTGSRRGSRGSSNASATSLRSTRSSSGAERNDRKMSTAHQLHQHNQLQHQLHLLNHQQQQQDKEKEPQQQPLITNITSNPVAESVTVEIIEP
ncbi:hypothetical protein ACFFRR_005706 [Megaselia abdita]